MGFGDTFSYYEYESDDTKTYNVKLSAITAANGGFTEADSAFSNPSWPFDEKDMRHVAGNDGAHHESRQPIASNTNALYQNAAGTFTAHGREFTITSAMGENRKITHVK
jgi:hypothetical protein